MQHTPEQKAIIESAVGNLLVSAAAGSGKTAVLTDRIVLRIVTGQLDIRQILVMTFTETAARSMKEKIEQKLRSALQASNLDPAGRQRLSRQLSVLPGAAISTIHAFCLDVIRNFYYCAKNEQGQPLIEPDFSIGDEIESDLLLHQALDELMNRQYEAIDLAMENQPDEVFAANTAFYRLIEGYGDSRSDKPVRELILGLHRFLRSLPNYPEFVANRLQELQNAAADFSASPHMEALLQMLRICLDRALSKLHEMQSLLDGKIRFITNPDRNEVYNRQFQAALQALCALHAYLERGGQNWDEIRDMSKGLAEISLPRGTRNDSPEKLEFMALFCENTAEVVYLLSGSCGTDKCQRHFIFDTQYIFSQTSSEIEADIAAMLPSIRLLFEWVLGLDQQYTLRKRTAGIIDFNDFEHLALTILQQEEPQKYYRQRFREVYVDEYQDTSSIQEAIIQAVSADNCLMVGDVKQSIYRFRHARPGIFIEKAAAFRNGHKGQLFELNCNFRSVAGILTAANQLFGQLMSSGAGEIEYDDSQALLPHRPADPACPAPVTLMLLNRLPEQNTKDEADFQRADQVEEAEQSVQTDEAELILAEELNRDQKEAWLVILKMHQLHEKGHSWKSMAVLSRTRAIGQTYQIQLESYGIPTWIDKAESFLDTPVLRQMEALIHVLDNIRQDIPLTAVMRSSLFQGGFSLEELAAIRLNARRHDPDNRFFYQAVLNYAAQGPAQGTDLQLGQRAKDFINWLSALRERGQVLSLGELIGLVFAETGWLDRLAAEPDGERQIRDLQKFQQWAEQFESRQQRGLYVFARLLESLRSKGSEKSPFAAEIPDQDAVRIMTIHGSKGLEFPIVFLVGTGYRITPKDSQDRLLLSERLGIGMDFADPQIQIRYPTHLKLAMLEETKAKSLAEELRLLYVAVTRAMDQLYIAGTVRLRPGSGDGRLQQLWQQASQIKDRKIPDYLVLAGRTYLEWLLLALARHPDLDWSFLETGICAEKPETAAEETLPVWNLELRQLAAVQQDLAAHPEWIGQPAQDSSLQENPATAKNPAELIEAVLANPGQGAAADQEYQAAWQRIAAPYRYELAARTPVKLTVSELKRREQIAAGKLQEDGAMLRGISLVMDQYESEANISPENAGMAASGLTNARIGTLLHAIFRYLDLPQAYCRPGPSEISRQFLAMQQAGMFTSAELTAITPLIPAILKFIQSDLAGEMVHAYKDPRQPIYLEMPFTLAVPAREVYPSENGLAPADRVLVQGIIDCWYENGEEVTLIDYKSDHLPDDPIACQTELANRYALQLDYYARAVATASGKPCKRRLIWLIRQGRAFDLADSEPGP